MSKVSGYFAFLTKERRQSFDNRGIDLFAEPVAEFKHSRNVPLICFIIDELKQITHVGLGKRGLSAGTDLRRLNIEKILPLKKELLVKKVIDLTSSRLRGHLYNKIEKGGLIPPKSFNEFLEVFIKEAPETAPVLSLYSQGRQRRIDKLTKSEKKSLAEQKEAILTAINIAGIDKSEALGYDYSEKVGPTSFLDGLEKVRLREDSMVINDLANFPGYNLLKTTKFSSSVFQNDKSKLTVILTNRLPLEELLGTDLIYYNEDFKCFIMVQYKVMEKENEDFIFRIPSHQLDEEIKRMDSINEALNLIKNEKSINDYRVSPDPFFLKICPRIDFDPDNVGLSKGMYIPLEYLKILQNDDTTKGPKGGQYISYNNIGRYFDNTGFKTIIEGGWIGTNQNQSKLLERLIRGTLENGRTSVIAIKSKISQVGSLDNESIEDAWRDYNSS